MSESVREGLDGLKISLSGRVALVTGASRGIGRAIAVTLARAGADVAVNFRKDAEAAAETVSQIEAIGGRAKAFSASVEDFDQDVAMIEGVIDAFGRLDILVNNAGISSRGNPVVDTEALELSRVMGVHAFGPHFLARAALPHLRKHARSDIVMISTTTTLDFPPRGAPYTMAKAAMEALAYTLAKEERGYGVRTNIVSPGLTATDMGERLAQAETGGTLEALDEKSPFGRVSRPEDIANVVAFLVSDLNSYANGQRVNVDGGGRMDISFTNAPD